METLPDLTQWNASIAELPGANILQTAQWAALKADYAWRALPRVWRDAQGNVQAAALVLRRELSVRGMASGLSVLYVPRGPLLDWADAALRERVMADLQLLARREKAIFIKMDPELALGTGIPGTADAQESATGQAVKRALGLRGWRYSHEQIQFRNTVWLDLQADEAAWLARMKPKTRYNLRLAEKKGVQVRVGTLDDLPELYHLYAETSVRDGFVIRDSAYYLKLWTNFLQAGMLDPLIAEVDGQKVAALMLFHFAGRAWYLHGMSGENQREKMPNYLLQWRAMQTARAHGCTSYDLWGAPEIFDESDSMWGVFRFKEGLGGQVVRTLGAWDYAARPGLYTAYTRILPWILERMRRRGKARTRQEV